MSHQRKKTQTTLVVCVFFNGGKKLLLKFQEERSAGLRIRQLLVKSVSTQVCKPIFFFCFVNLPDDLLAL